MATLFQDAMQGYHNLILNDKYADPRTKNFFLISNPLLLVPILGSYLYFVLKCGPRWMEDRKPYQLKNTLIYYNAFQVLLSAYMALEGTAIWTNYNFWCEETEHSDSPKTIRMINLCWVYFIAKLTELMDTVLFVLRKKNNQISFLHVFHHTLMPITMCLGMRYITGGHATLFIILNCYVHVVMYSYYLIAALGPKYQKYLWWKRQVTEIQLLQFFTIFLHNLVPLLTSSCGVPKWLNFLALVYGAVFMYLFGEFYVKIYIWSKKKKTQVTQKKEC